MLSGLQVLVDAPDSNCEAVLHAGANIRADLSQTYNFSMRLMDGTVEQGGVWGMRIDYWDEATSSFPPESSYFFYDSSLRLSQVRVSALMAVPGCSAVGCAGVCPGLGLTILAARTSLCMVTQS